MTILIFEENLIWSARLRSGVAALGYTPIVVSRAEVPIPDADAAILNLGSQVFDASALAPELQSRGMKVVAHAGHKESERLEIGRQAGCDLIVSNGTLTHKLGETLAQVLGLKVS